MCELVSWLKVDKNVFFLTDDDLKGRKFAEYKNYNPQWRQDIYGHGAIFYFYPELKNKGVQEECTDFSSPDNFPKEIVTAIKNCKLTKFNIAKQLLTQLARREYDMIKQSTWEEYYKIWQLNRDKYIKIRTSAQDKYNGIKELNWDEYNRVRLLEFWKLFKVKKNRVKAWR